MTRAEIMQEIKRRVLEVVPEAEVWLYGSQARGDYNDDSDWDILIITEQNLPMSIKDQIINTLADLGIDIGELINPVIISKDTFIKFRNDIFLQNVLEEKLIL